VRPGYKQTEVGVIPEEWDVSGLQQACREAITYGIVQCGPHIRDGVPYIRVSDMDAPELSLDAMLRTSKSIASKFARSTVEEGDLVYALRGKLGEVRQVRAELVGANLTQGTARLSPNDRLVSDYLVWAMRDPRAVRQAELEAKGTTFREITLADLRRIKVLVPPKHEQRAIATALSDVDALLGGLDQLIAKKRDLKLATMQQLLTGKTRLPGFDGEWEVKRLDQFAPLQRGFDLPTSQIQSGDYPVVYSNGVQNHHAKFMVKGPGVVTGRSGTIGNVHFVEDDFWPHNTALWVTDFKLNDPKFVFHFLTSVGLERFGTGSGVPTLNRNDVHEFHVSVPSLLAEQAAIAAVLADMDAELAMLEARRAKTRDLKQAMMQELLTGKTRLVPRGRVHV
jgi:type I restriction enzyme S subunit